MQPYIARMVEEQVALTEKLAKLRMFLETQTFSALPLVERILLVTQREAMDIYEKSLGQRIELAQKREQDAT